MNWKRTLNHLFLTHNKLRKAFPEETLERIEKAIAIGEKTHSGQLRFAVEHALHFSLLSKGLTPRERALELFAQLGVWDTEHNNGVLLYLLLADRAMEIVADRGICQAVPPEQWQDICRDAGQLFAEGDFEQGVLHAVELISGKLAFHFPARGEKQNELPDSTVVI